jgi:hypothetical protein
MSEIVNTQDSVSLHIQIVTCHEGCFKQTLEARRSNHLVSCDPNSSNDGRNLVPLKMRFSCKACFCISSDGVYLTNV